jgi:hypothetical protein
MIARHKREQSRLALALRLLALDAELYGILTAVAISHGLSLTDILAFTRTRAITDARHEFFYRAMSETSKSSVSVGHICARDHAAVLYGSSKWALDHGRPIPRGGAGGKYLRHRKKNTNNLSLSLTAEAVG